MTQEELLNKILAKLVNVESYMHENMFTQKQAEEMESRLLSHIDGFIKLHEAVMLELTSMRSSHKRLEERLKKVELKLGITVEA